MIDDIFGYETKELSGEDLITQGYTVDTFKKPIVIGTEYIVKLYHKQKRMTIISDSDRKIADYYAMGMQIVNEGGLISWANFRVRLDLMEKSEDCIPMIEELIQCYNGREDFEKSDYMSKQLKQLKNDERRFGEEPREKQEEDAVEGGSPHTRQDARAGGEAGKQRRKNAARKVRHVGGQHAGGGGGQGQALDKR
jgi:hypothetical protein